MSSPSQLPASSEAGVAGSSTNLSSSSSPSSPAQGPATLPPHLLHRFQYNSQPSLLPPASSTTFPPPPSTSTPLPPPYTQQLRHLHLSPRQMLAAQQHFGGATAAFAGQQQQAKQDDDLANLAAPMWQVDEYDAFIKSLIDGQDTSILAGAGGSDHISDPSFDFDATAMSSVPGSHASSYFSGASDNGASPSSFHDFVYGVHNFPTPPDSDFGNGSYLDGRSASISMLSGVSPSSIDASFEADGAFTGQTAASVPMLETSAMDIPPGLLQGAVAAFAASASGLQPAEPAWDPNFLAPASAASMPITGPSNVVGSTTCTATSVASTSAAPATQVAPNADAKKRSAAEMVSANGTAKKASKTKPKATGTTADRVTKKLKGNAGIPDKAVLASLASTGAAGQSSSSSSRPATMLPHMEVGSNATALAAIERLKAKRLREAEEAAEAQRAKLLAQAAADEPSSSSSSSATGKAEGGDSKPELTPQMRQQKKVAHNAIERRYRNNINDRIAALRNAVPALRELRPRKTASGRKSRKAQQEEDLVDGVPAATKLNKATILGKATDYIKYLKGRELRLASEVTGLRELIRSLEGGEELLELWESEMDKVVAEQEAAAAAAAAKEEEDMSLQLEGDDEEDDDDEEGDEDEMSGGVSAGSSPSDRALSGRPTKRARGSKLALAPSRYMLATFLGVSLLGGGAEYAIDSTAGDSTVAVSRPSPGRVVVGASHQLLKRSTAYLSPPSTAPEAHHFDNVPTHTLLFEVVRNVSLAVCFVLLVWPLIAHFMFRRTRGDARTRQRQNRRAAEATLRRRKEMLNSLSKSNVAPADVDAALRRFVGAPRSALAAVVGSVQEAAGLAPSTYVAKRSSAHPLDSEHLAVWARLLEVETSLEKLAQPSFVLRLHTALKVANAYSSASPNRNLPSDAILSPARIFGTLAIAYAKLGDGVELVQDAADRKWDLARASIATLRDVDDDAALLDAETSSSSASDSDSDDARTINSDDEQRRPDVSTTTALASSTKDGWVDAVLKLDLDEALTLLASPQVVSVSLLEGGTPLPADHAETSKKYRLSPLIAIADTLYTRELGEIWTSLFSSLVRGTCPTPAELSITASTVDGSGASFAEAEMFDLSPLSSLASVRDFCDYHASSHLDLDVVNDADSKTQMNLRIAKLAATAPHGTGSWELARVTLATWALMVGNVGMARGVASLVLSLDAATEGEGEGENAAKAALRRLILGVDVRGGSTAARAHGLAAPAAPPHDAIDALAASVLGWLHYLRLFSRLRQTYRLLSSAAGAGGETGFYLSSLSSQRTSLLEHTASLRRSLHAARMAGSHSAEAGWSGKQQVKMDEDVDELADILSAVGRRVGASVLPPLPGSLQGNKAEVRQAKETALKAFRWIEAGVSADETRGAEDSGVEL